LPESIKKKVIARNRRKRLYGLNDSILSNKTVFLLPYAERSSDFKIQEAAMYAAT